MSVQGDFEGLEIGEWPLPEPFYGTELNGEKFFYIGNIRIKVSEHFNKDGKPLEDLLEDVIKYSAKLSL